MRMCKKQFWNYNSELDSKSMVQMVREHNIVCDPSIVALCTEMIFDYIVNPGIPRTKRKSDIEVWK